jgi:hypothetical protein
MNATQLVSFSFVFRKSQTFVRKLSGRVFRVLFFVTAFLVATAQFTWAQTQNQSPAYLGGRAAGSARVGDSGAASFSVPIIVPPGTAGVAPNLSLVYSSQSSENELLGIGWSLAGLPSIERCPATIAQDNFRGGVHYDSSDRFCLDKQRLMAVSGTYGANLTEYRTEIDSGLKIVSFGTSGSGPSYFKVWTKQGQVMELGNSTDSRIEAQNQQSVRVWALNKLQDAKGNYLSVSYFEDNANGEYRPTRIDYTNGSVSPTRSVQFVYTSRADVIPLYEGGSLFRTSVLMTNIQTYVGGSLVRDYRLTYETGSVTGRSRLTSITECAGTSCMPSNTFGWQDTILGFSDPANWVSHGGQYSGGRVHYADVNGDGKADLIYQGDPNNTFYVSISTGNGFAPFQTWVTHGGSFTFGQAQFADVNGDGKADLIFQDDNNGFWVSLSTGTGFTSPSLWVDHGGTFKTGQAQYADLNGDGRADLIFDGEPNNTFYVSLSTGTAFTAPAPWDAHGGNFIAGQFQLADVDGDGKADLIFQRFSTSYGVGIAWRTDYGPARTDRGCQW